MSKKILILVILAIIAIMVSVIYINLKVKSGEEQEIGMNHTDNKNPNFNFKTKTVKLNSGYEMPLNGIGTYSLTGETCYNSIVSALNSGVRLIDTAYMYNNEEEIGKGIKASNVHYY